MNRGRRTPRNLILARTLLGAMLLVSVVLIFLANFVPRPADAADVREALEEAARNRVTRANAVKEARAALPATAPIPRDWKFSTVLDALESKGLRGLLFLVSSYVDSPEDISDATLSRLRGLLADGDREAPGNPFSFSFDVDRQSKQEVLARLRSYLAGLKALRDVEAGMDFGLCQDVVDGYASPRYSNIVNLCVLFAGRAVCEAQQGEQGRALDTCLTGFRVARLLGEWPHFYSYMERYFADHMMDRALFSVMDAGMLSEQDQTRLLEAFDGRKSSEGLAKALRLCAAYLEAGLEGEARGYPGFSDYGFAFTGRGSMERAKRIGVLLDRPPYSAAQELAQIGDHTMAGYWVNLLCDNGIQSYKMHAREALMGDIVRVVFALKAHARKTGAYPASLGELNPPPVPEVLDCQKVRLQP